ncbi:CLUMA_CG008508, isoform A [Clunio marinus]|uniref:CLUMA_CG008508, isoform A n=1 Tax=Clunio marinus TaxID=568069 RepID=A0A1J1I7T6_9DIPT|nr:CLUMA_CG008508, isoform A [Clunio marinus]
MAPINILRKNLYCRLCLEDFYENEMQIPINNQINNQFFDITQIPLTASENYSKAICESCFNSLEDCATLGQKLIDKQKTLEKIYESLKEYKQKFKRDEIFSSTRLDFEEGEIDQELSFSDEDLDELNTDEKNSRKNSLCRLCLRIFCDDDKQIPINNQINNQFVKMTQIALTASKKYSKFVCENCFKVLKGFATFRSKLIDKQKKLEKKYNTEKGYEKKLIRDEIFTSTKIDFEEQEGNKERNFSDKNESTASKIKVSDDKNNNTKPDFVEREGNQELNFSDKDESIVIKKREKFHCDHCNYSDCHKNELLNHIRTHFIIKAFTCHICSADFTTQKDLVEHAIYISDNPFFCDIDGCFTAFKTEIILWEHVKKIHEHFQFHQPPQPQTTCHVCGKIYKQKKNLKQHLLYHQPPKHCCEICNRKMYTRGELTVHIRNVHDGRKDFQCHICDKKFTKSHTLKQHMIRIHLKQKLTCKVNDCNESFEKKYLFRRHILKAHPDLGITDVDDIIDRIKTNSGGVKKLNGHVLVYISEVSSPTRLWIQEAKIDEVEKLSKEMGVFYNKYHEADFSLSSYQIKIGMRVAVNVFSEWNRAEVISEVNPNTKDVRLFFIDYGTTGFVPYNCCKILFENFSALPRKSYRGAVYGIRPKGNKRLWNLSITDEFVKYIRNKIHHIEIVNYHEQEDFYEFLLYDDSNNIVNYKFDSMEVENAISNFNATPSLCLSYPPFTFLEKLVVYPTLSERFQLLKRGVDFNKFEEEIIKTHTNVDAFKTELDQELMKNEYKNFKDAFFDILQIQ